MLQYASLAVDGITLGSIYALVAIGFHLIFRTAGVLDFAQGDKVVLGGLLGVSIVQIGLPAWATLALVAAAGIFLGVIYDRLVIRPSGRNGVVPAIVATVGAALILASGHALIWGANGLPFDPLTPGLLRVGGVPIPYQSFWVLGVLILVEGGLATFLKRARFGKAMVAAATDPVAATTVGINVGLVRVTAFALAFGLAALAGVLIAPFTLAGGAQGPSLTLKGFTGGIIGGLESTIGVAVGSVLLGLIENVVGGIAPNGFRDPIDFILLLVVLLVLPSGLFGRRHRRLA